MKKCAWKRVVSQQRRYWRNPTIDQSLTEGCGLRLQTSACLKKPFFFCARRTEKTLTEVHNKQTSRRHYISTNSSQLFCLGSMWTPLVISLFWVFRVPNIEVNSVALSYSFFPWIFSVHWPSSCNSPACVIHCSPSIQFCRINTLLCWAMSCSLPAGSPVSGIAL